MSQQPVEVLAQRLEEALLHRRPIPPLSEEAGLAQIPEAYAVQRHWMHLRTARGERIVGRKIGLTSAAMQTQLGVNEPDYGCLWGSRYFPLQAGRVEVPYDLFLQPRVEGEVAFLLGRPLRGPHVTLQDVLAAAEAVTAGIEIIDSRIADWRIRITDTIADNASFGGFATGPWSSRMREADLRLVGMILWHNGRAATEGLGAAALGHPARCVAWLANKLAEFGEELRAGDIVFSGSLGRAVPVQRGDVVTLEMAGFPSLSVRFV
ncbi:MAG: 2-keto-4-pentenoate hydratase [Armatimonadota bacterium]|nr:2-keto-4-pentenoate hydratase [Armatimonadota bacterium]MDR7563129.1 2-keto-4-pentenoate hydratase [Armatimonadota bacterium]MDR7568412.1 2-keto-4-pentenoate hydratase [Armatimonadota bacterium]MDR7600954.1 2-keto-4-pentenoate hydratase [Armatimonadota bacterium]